MRALACLCIALASCNVVELREPLEPPRRVRAVAGITSVTIHWDAVAAADSYFVYHAADPTVGPENFESVGGVRIPADRSPLTITGLAANQERFFAVASRRDKEVTPPPTSVSARPLPGPLVAPTPGWSSLGPPAASYGARLAHGDIDGDGRDDIVVGAPFFQTNAGLVDVFYGRDVISANGDETRFGATGDFFGQAIEVADIDGDGYDDVLIGAPGSVPNVVTIEHGGPNGLGVVTTIGPGTAAGYGEAIDSGDLDGDGDLDVVVGAFGTGGVGGEVYIHINAGGVLSPTPSATITGATSAEGTGRAVAIARFDDDVFADVVVGEHTATAEGHVRIFRGTTTLPTNGYTIAGTYAQSRYGTWVANAGDVNADGRDEILVGDSPASAGTPRVYVESDGFQLAELPGVSAPASSRLSGAGGDADGDGWADVLVGDPHASGDRGALYLYRGGAAALSSSAAWTITGANAGDALGSAVAIALDANGDGPGEIVAGAPAADAGAGRSFLFHVNAARGISVDAGVPILDFDGANGQVDGAAFSDPYGSGPWTCRWTWFDGDPEFVITPCDGVSVNGAVHDGQGTAIGWGKLRVTNDVDGRYGEAIVPVIPRGPP